MSHRNAGGANLEKLLRIARAEADALRADLADIERARVAAEAGLEALEKDIREESVRADGADFARFIDGARERRRNLTATVFSLRDAEAAARANLEAAFVELKKLDHLLESERTVAARGKRRADARKMDDIAAAMGRR